MYGANGNGVFGFNAFRAEVASVACQRKGLYDYRVTVRNAAYLLVVASPARRQQAAKPWVRRNVKRLTTLRFF